MSTVDIEKVENRLNEFEELIEAYPIDLHFPQTYEEAIRPIIIRKDNQDENN